jgi:hypothetical protein
MDAGICNNSSRGEKPFLSALLNTCQSLKKSTTAYTVALLVLKKALSGPRTFSIKPAAALGIKTAPLMKPIPNEAQGRQLLYLTPPPTRTCNNLGGGNEAAFQAMQLLKGRDIDTCSAAPQQHHICRTKAIGSPLLIDGMPLQHLADLCAQLTDHGCCVHCLGTNHERCTKLLSSKSKHKHPA